MSSKTRALWNRNAVGEGLLLDESGLIVTTAANALDNHRKILATVPKAVSSGNAEHGFWSTPQVSLGTNAIIGFASPDSPLDKAVGEDAKSWGYCPATGDITNDNSVIYTVAASLEQKIISTILKQISGHPHFILAVEGSWLISITLDDGPYVNAATLAGGNMGETSLSSNWGQRGMRYPRITTPAS